MEFQSGESHVSQTINVCSFVLAEPDKSPAPKPVRLLLNQFGKLPVVDASNPWPVEDEQVRYQVSQGDQPGTFNAKAIHFPEQAVNVACLINPVMVNIPNARHRRHGWLTFGETGN